MRKQIPTWDLYLITDGKTRQLVKNAVEQVYLDKYFTGLVQNIQKHPEMTAQDYIESYKKLWEKHGELRSFYTDSWGHKWVCFPNDDKLLKYLHQYIKE